MHHQRSQLPLYKLLFRSSFIVSPPKHFSNSSPSPKLNTPSIPFPKPTSNFHHFLPLPLLNPRTHFLNFQNSRHFSGGRPDGVDQNKVLDEINLKFAEAREEIEMAMESKETVYFDEEAECARAAVKDVLELYDGLLAKLAEDKKEALQRSMGLKIEQLKAELQQLNE